MVGALTVAVSIALRVLDPAPVAALRGLTFDFFQRLSPRPYADLPVRIVDIDDASLAQHGQWPWPRTQVATRYPRPRRPGTAATGQHAPHRPSRLRYSYIGERLNREGYRTHRGASFCAETVKGVLLSQAMVMFD
jgi:hypothetical protein